MDLVGTVDGCDCVIVDDMIDTAGTLCKAANQLKEHGGMIDLIILYSSSTCVCFCFSWSFL